MLEAGDYVQKSLLYNGATFQDSPFLRSLFTREFLPLFTVKEPFREVLIPNLSPVICWRHVENLFHYKSTVFLAFSQILLYLFRR